jgi:hypothetical protein
MNINIKNLEMKPDSGGIPAIDNNVTMQLIKKNCKLPKPFNSFNVLNNRKSNINIKLNIENNKEIYIIIFTRTIPKPNSLKKLSEFIIL